MSILRPARAFDSLYRSFTGVEASYDDLAYRCRKLIVRVALASELNVLANQLTRIALSKRNTCDFTLNSLRDALTEVVANFPVYRTYVTPAGISENDAGYIRRAIALAKWRSPAADTSVFDFVRQVLLTQYRGRTRSCLPKSHHRLRHEVPAVHQSSDGERSGRHSFLSLQPARLA